MPRVPESVNVAPLQGCELGHGAEQALGVRGAFHEEFNPSFYAGHPHVLAGDGESASHLEPDVCRRLEWHGCGHGSFLSATEFISSAAKTREPVLAADERGDWA